MENIYQNRSSLVASWVQGLRYLIVLALGAGLLIGCAGPDMERPVAQMTRAEVAIQDATQAGARESAARELQSAQRHFGQAQRASTNEDFAEAMRLAEKAEADAELAEATARNATTQTTVAELKEGIRVLQEELDRSLN